MPVAPSTEKDAAVILLDQALGLLPAYPAAATATQVMVVGILVEQAKGLLSSE